MNKIIKTTIFNFFYVTLKLYEYLGVLPTTTNHKNHENTSCVTRRSTILCVALYIAVAVVYPFTAFSIISVNGLHDHNISTYATIIEYFLCYLIMLTVWPIQIFNRYAIAETINECFGLFRIMKSLIQCSQSLVRLTLFFVAKTFIFGIPLLYFVWSNMSSFVIQMDFVLAVYSIVNIIPVIVIITISNIFYGSILFVSYCLITLNSSLQSYVNRVNQMGIGGGGGGFSSTFDQLWICDRIDELSGIYGKIYQIAVKINRIKSISVLMTVAHGFISVVIQVREWFLFSFLKNILKIFCENRFSLST